MPVQSLVSKLLDIKKSSSISLLFLLFSLVSSEKMVSCDRFSSVKTAAFFSIFKNIKPGPPSNESLAFFRDNSPKPYFDGPPSNEGIVPQFKPGPPSNEALDAFPASPFNPGPPSNE